AHVHAIQQDLTRVGIVEAHQQTEQRALASSRFASNTQTRTSGDGKGNIVQNLLLPIIAKGHPLKFHSSIGTCERTSLWMLRDIWGFVQELQGAFQARLRRLQANDSVANGCQRSIQLAQIRHNNQQLPNREAFCQYTVHPQVEHYSRTRGREDVADDTI